MKKHAKILGKKIDLFCEMATELTQIISLREYGGEPPPYWHFHALIAHSPVALSPGTPAQSPGSYVGATPSVQGPACFRAPIYKNLKNYTS
jgi:hypothetical protein